MAWMLCGPDVRVRNASAVQVDGHRCAPAPWTTQTVIVCLGDATGHLHIAVNPAGLKMRERVPHESASTGDSYRWMQRPTSIMLPPRRRLRPLSATSLQAHARPGRCARFDFPPGPSYIAHRARSAPLLPCQGRTARAPSSSSVSALIPPMPTSHIIGALIPISDSCALGRIPIHAQAAPLLPVEACDDGVFPFVPVEGSERGRRSSCPVVAPPSPSMLAGRRLLPRACRGVERALETAGIGASSSASAPMRAGTHRPL
ncbi:hypothetical protein B0H19DRAFT_69586 [Mycena capillaripes]|nr:hypothetical protein B0H19DRAFT_69586 [Mycena capillaripes]